MSKPVAHSAPIHKPNTGAFRPVSHPSKAATTAATVAALLRSPDGAHFPKFVDANLKEDWTPNKKVRRIENKKLNTIVLTPSPNQSSDADIIRDLGLKPDANGFITVEKVGKDGVTKKRIYKQHDKPNPHNENRLIPVAGDGVLPLTGAEYTSLVTTAAKSRSTSFRNFLSSSLATDPTLKAAVALSTQMRDQLSPSPTTPKAPASSSSEPPRAQTTPTPPPTNTPTPSACSSSTPTPSTPTPASSSITPPPTTPTHAPPVASVRTPTPPPASSSSSSTTPTPPTVVTAPVTSAVPDKRGVKRKLTFEKDELKS